MRKRQLKSQVIYILLFALSLVSVFGFSYFSNRVPPVTSCHQWGFISTRGAKYYIHPDKVVVKPWRGRHHVYGIFMIPRGSINDHLFKVTIKGNDNACGTITSSGMTFAEGIYAKPGYYLMRGHLNTRSAILLILQGKIYQLKQPKNWKVGYSKIQ